MLTQRTFTYSNIWGEALLNSIDPLFMKAVKKLLITCSSMAFTLFTSHNIFAQQSVELIMDNFTSSVISQTSILINNAAVESSMRNANRKRGTDKALTSKIDLSYTPTKALQQKTLQQLTDKLTSKNAAAGQAVKNALGSGKANYDQLFKQMVQESGLPANNAATALAAYLEIGYMIVNNVQGAGTVTTAMDKALQRQTTALLSKNKNLNSTASVSKLGEELKLQAVVLYLGWQSSLKTTQLEQFRSGITQQFKGMGIDMSRLKLTTQGFVKK